MNPNYTYSLDDRMNPIYCVGCKQHIPRNLSTAGNGFCPLCMQSRQNAQQQAAQWQRAQQQAAQSQAQQQQSLLYHTNTGIGLCPQCQSPHLMQMDNTVPDNTGKGLQGAGCALGCISMTILWPLLIVAVAIFVIGCFFKGTKNIGTSRQCHYCNHRWLV